MDFPYIEIVEQPASRAVRFRYESEGRLSGTLIGANSTKECRTFPKIRIYGMKRCKMACLIICCVTKDPPYCNHPYTVSNNESEINGNPKNRGIIRMALCPESAQPYQEIEFKDLRLQCVKETDVKSALEYRKTIGVDPFGTSTFQIMAVENMYMNANLNALRLCFQVFFDDGTGVTCRPRTSVPVVSDIIYDRKATSPLEIQYVTPRKGSVRGGTNITIICDKVQKNEIEIRFFQLEGDEVVWEAYVDQSCIDIYKQMSITIKTPAYYTWDVSQPIPVYLELVRPKDGKRSSAVSFELLPMDWAKKASKQNRNWLASGSNLTDLILGNRCTCILRPIVLPDCAIHGLKVQQPQVTENNDRTILNDFKRCSINATDKKQFCMNINFNDARPREAGEKTVEAAPPPSTSVHPFPQNQPGGTPTASLKKPLSTCTNSNNIVAKEDSEVIETLTKED